VEDERRWNRQFTENSSSASALVKVGVGRGQQSRQGDIVGAQAALARRGRVGRERDGVSLGGKASWQVGASAEDCAKPIRALFATVDIATPNIMLSGNLGADTVVTRYDHRLPTGIDSVCSLTTLMRSLELAGPLIRRRQPAEQSSFRSWGLLLILRT
jgi:hypothetical protein